MTEIRWRYTHAHRHKHNKKEKNVRFVKNSAHKFNIQTVLIQQLFTQNGSIRGKKYITLITNNLTK